MENSLCSMEGSWRTEGSGMLHRGKDRDRERDASWVVPAAHAPAASPPAGVLTGKEVIGSRHDDGEGGKGKGKVERVDGPLPIAVWASVMDTSKGRDKVLVSWTSLGPCLVDHKSPAY
jgi:hypothetical protein